MTDKSGLAYSNDDYIGVSGVEYTMEAYLTGATKQRQGSREVEINKNLSITRELSSTPAKDGDNGMLTVAGGIVITFTKEILALITG